MKVREAGPRSKGQVLQAELGPLRSPIVQYVRVQAKIRRLYFLPQFRSPVLTTTLHCFPIPAHSHSSPPSQMKR